MVIFARCWFTGDQQALVKLEELGNKEAWMLTLKFQALNSGMVTKVIINNIGQTVVIIDEFRGDIGISNLLRWFDRYPCLVEIKGSSTVLCAQLFIVTSNLHPRDWYPTLDTETFAALERRMEVTHVPFPLYNSE